MTAGVEASLLRGLLDLGLTGLGLDPDEARRECLVSFLRLLGRWNNVYNLTAVRDPREMMPRHILDSLAVHPYLFGGPVLDVGTGPGLPGIPLAILDPSRQFVLLDSNGKKTRFVRQAALDLGLANVDVVQARMESYRPTQKFVTIVSRAVGSLSWLSTATEPLLARPARLLVMKGRYPRGELDSLHSQCPAVHRLTVPFLDGERHLIEIRYD